MIKKLLAKLTGSEWSPQPNKFQQEQKTESELAEERRQEILRQRKEGQTGNQEEGWQEVELPTDDKESGR